MTAPVVPEGRLRRCCPLCDRGMSRRDDDICRLCFEKLEEDLALLLDPE